MRTFTLPGRVLTGLSLLLILALALTACGVPTPADSAAGQPDLIVTLSAPDGPTGQTLLVSLTDKDGTAIIDAKVGLEGNMNHAGMTPVLADPVTDLADGNMDGVYRLPFTFTMRGDWIVTVSVTLADGTIYTQDIDLTVTANEVQVK